MSATFSSQNPSAAGQQSVPPGHSPHHGGPPPGHAIHGGGPPAPGGMQGPVPNGVPGQSAPHHGPPPSQYPGHHPPGPPSSMPNGYVGQPSGTPGAPPSSSMPSQQANPQVIQKVSKKNRPYPNTAKSLIVVHIFYLFWKDQLYINKALFFQMLDENSALIKTISDYQNAGKHSETVQYQWTLHRNLVYLASVADSNQNLQNLLPVNINVMYYST